MQTDQIADAKHLIFEGMLKATEQGLEPGTSGVLVDEQFGAPDRPARAGQGARAAAVDAGGEVGTG